jgi:hypothetical protein
VDRLVSAVDDGLTKLCAMPPAVNIGTVCGVYLTPSREILGAIIGVG